MHTWAEGLGAAGMLDRRAQLAHGTQSADLTAAAAQQGAIQLRCQPHDLHSLTSRCSLQRRTALHLAAWAGQVDCLKALLAAGANHNADAQDGMNAL